MTRQDEALALVERIPDEDWPVVRSVLEHFARRPTTQELLAVANSAPFDDEEESEEEAAIVRERIAEWEAMKARGDAGIPHHEVQERIYERNSA